MALKYKLVQEGNPSDSGAPKKVYASVVNTCSVTLRMLANEIAGIATVSQADTMAVIDVQ